MLRAAIAIFKSLPITIIALAILITVLVLVGSVGWLRSLPTPEPITAQIDLSDTIISTLSARSQLLTAETTIRDLPVRVNVRGGIANALGYGATYETDIVIKVGFNFIRDEFQVLKQGENEYEVRLPKAELLSCSMSPVQDVDRSTSITADWDSAKQLAEYMLMQQAVREAIDDNNLFAVARANAREAINDLIAQINGDIRLTYVFLESETTHIDDTCQIREPLLWEYNAEEQSWRKK